MVFTSLACAAHMLDNLKKLLLIKPYPSLPFRSSIKTASFFPIESLLLLNFLNHTFWLNKDAFFCLFGSFCLYHYIFTMIYYSHDRCIHLFVGPFSYFRAGHGLWCKNVSRNQQKIAGVLLRKLVISFLYFGTTFINSTSQHSQTEESIV